MPDAFFFRHVHQKQQHKQHTETNNNGHEMSDITLFSKSKSKKKLVPPQREQHDSSTPPNDEPEYKRPKITTFDENVFQSEQQQNLTMNSDDDDDSDIDDNDGDITEQPSFKKLGLSPWLCNHLSKLHMNIPTIIQQKCIPATLAQKKNVIAMSKTGSGKTAAFALPIIELLARDLFGVFALVITPTRELALQIKDNFKILSGDLPLRCVCITGGMDYLKQAELLESSPHVVVGTPGRIEHALRTFSRFDYFKRVKFLVFDEADRLLSSNFALDVECILKHLPPAQQRQTLLYSATMNSHVKKLANMTLKKDQRGDDSLFLYDACRLYDTADNLDQFYMFIPHAVKDCYLYALLNWMQNDKENVDSSVICMVFFQNTKDCELACQTMKLLDIDCASLHSAKSQRERSSVLGRFRARKIKALFSTDVANRGLDIPSVNFVINYDLPETTDRYVHRVGRTARAGRGGSAISLVSQYEITRLKSIEADTKLTLKNFAMGKDFLNKDEVENQLYMVSEKRCRAKIEMLQNGFQENFENVKNKQKLTDDLLKQASVFYEKQYLNQLKSSSNWRTKLKQGVQHEYEKEKESRKPQPLQQQHQSNHGNDESGDEDDAFMQQVKQKLKADVDGAKTAEKAATGGSSSSSSSSSSGNTKATQHPKSHKNNNKKGAHQQPKTSTKSNKVPNKRKRASS